MHVGLDHTLWGGGGGGVVAVQCLTCALRGLDQGTHCDNGRQTLGASVRKEQQHTGISSSQRASTSTPSPSQETNQGTASSLELGALNVKLWRWFQKVQRGGDRTQARAE